MGWIPHLCDTGNEVEKGRQQILSRHPRRGGLFFEKTTGLGFCSTRETVRKIFRAKEWAAALDGNLPSNPLRKIHSEPRHADL
jgi:hypothetical protein